MSFEKDIILVKQLIGFLEVAKCGQIKKAAQQMHMKQPNLSKMIKELEQDLNMQLFDRHSHNVTLTRSGSYIFKSACDIHKIFTDIQDITRTTHLFSGDLRLWTSEGLCSSYIPLCLKNFYAQFPEVQLEVITSLKDPTSLSEFDLGIVYREPQYKDAFVLYKGTLTFYLYGSKLYLAQYGYPKDLNDLKENHRLCIRKDFDALWPQWHDLFCNSKHIMIRTDSSNALFSFVKHGLGISLIPSCIADDTCLRVVDEVAIHQPFWIICPHHLKDVPKVRKLLEFLKKTIETL